MYVQVKLKQILLHIHSIVAVSFVFKTNCIWCCHVRSQVICWYFKAIC